MSVVTAFVDQTFKELAELVFYHIKAVMLYRYFFQGVTLLKKGLSCFHFWICNINNNNSNNNAYLCTWVHILWTKYSIVYFMYFFQVILITYEITTYYHPDFKDEKQI